MSQVKLTLRQPPNVEFVHGYPGIPSGGTDRPQAAVKGAVEVRVGNPQGVKAKWLRVELRKVETIPGSGGNVFYDYVGPSPVDVWRAHEEWDLVKTGDLAFEIRIPESIPPTLSLEGNVGIRYELIASICTKGKRGFLRKRKSNVVSAQTEIIIDKHDLHSTWPVYCQADVRQIDLDGVVLTVERHHTCYAPGDRVTVFAAVRSEFQTVILRGFEISLRESRTFRAGAYAQGKKTIPQTRVGNLTENKIPVNVTLMGGMIHKAELQLGIPPNHTTTTLNSARHIDITYVLCVRAIMGTGQPVVMELPVIMSNWPRNVSQEAIRRIGPAPGLSLLAASSAMHSVEPSRPPPSTFSGRPSAHEIVRPSANTFSPVSPTQSPLSNGSARPIDDFGVIGSRPALTTTRSSVDESGNSRRLTITNAQPMEIPVLPDAHSSRRRPSANATTPNGYIDEKKAYERAKATAERVQGNSPPPSRDGSGSAPIKKWMSAEEEKIKLYNSATARVNKTQGQASDSISEALPPSRGPSVKANGYMSAVDEKAALRRYQEAKNAVEVTQSVGFTNGVRDPPPFEAPSGSSSSGYESAAAEKARLKKELAAKSSSGSLAYESAAAEKARLKRELAERERRVSPSNDPPPFDANTSSSSGMNGHANGPSAYESAAAEKARLKKEMAEREKAVSGPPPVVSNGSSYESAAAEKTRLRREMEERDKRAMAASDLPPPFVGHGGSSSPPPFAGSSSPPQFGSSSPPPFVSSSPPPFSNGSSSSSGAGLSEKEILARHFAAQDAEASGSYSRPISRPTPTPPRAGTSMSAAEEKKMLAARYAGEGSSQSSATSTPPPLMPRPPAEYIQETRDEDARVSKFVMHDDIPLENGSVPAPPPLPPKPLGG